MGYHPQKKVTELQEEGREQRLNWDCWCELLELNMNQINCVNHKELVTSTAACFKSSKSFQHSPLCPEHMEELRLIFQQGAQSISISWNKTEIAVFYIE